MTAPRHIATAFALAFALVTGAVASGSAVASEPLSSASPSRERVSPPIETPPQLRTREVVEFDKSARSITDPKSYWVVANKKRPLRPKNYAPADIVQVPVAHVNPAQLRRSAASALVTMFAAAKRQGAGALAVQSSYRSYSVQVSVYNGWVARLGTKEADRRSARPGFSEHQTGLAVDLATSPASCTLGSCFGTTKQGRWLAKNAWKYGYLLRYPADKEKVTGYEYEPWHFRFIGKSLAAEMHKQKVTTLEEFFDLPAAPRY